MKTKPSLKRRLRFIITSLLLLGAIISFNNFAINHVKQREASQVQTINTQEANQSGRHRFMNMSWHSYNVDKRQQPQTDPLVCKLASFNNRLTERSALNELGIVNLKAELKLAAVRVQLNDQPAFTVKLHPFKAVSITRV